MVYIFFLSLFFQTIDANDCVHDALAFRCVKYIKNYDGDTVTFDIPQTHPLFGQKISVRVRSIDTPEINGKNPCEKEASRTARKLVNNLLKNAKRIDLLNPGRDKYFRILADVQYDGKDLKEIIKKNNLAYNYEGKKKQKIDWCQKIKDRYKNQPSEAL